MFQKYNNSFFTFQDERIHDFHVGFFGPKFHQISQDTAQLPLKQRSLDSFTNLEFRIYDDSFFNWQTEKKKLFITIFIRRSGSIKRPGFEFFKKSLF